MQPEEEEEEEEEDTGILSVPLEGWMQKRHRSGPNFWGKEWSRRWVSCNDEKGRLHVRKKNNQKDGDLVFSMSDVAEIRALKPENKDSSGLLHCFSISQPPMSVVLQCESEQERRKWMDGLSARVAHWKQVRLDEGLCVALTTKSHLATARVRSLKDSPSFGTGPTGMPHGLPPAPSAGVALPPRPPREPADPRPDPSGPSSAAPSFAGPSSSTPRPLRSASPPRIAPRSGAAAASAARGAPLPSPALPPPAPPSPHTLVLEELGSVRGGVSEPESPVCEVSELSEGLEGRGVEGRGGATGRASGSLRGGTAPMRLPS